MRLSVIIVSYNTRDLLRRCLASLGDGFEVIVVDNASSDGSAEMVRVEFPSVVLIENTVNKGFGTANNQGFDAMSGDLALLLNSDAYATPGAIDILLSTMKDQDVVACGGRLVNAGDESVTQNSCANELTLWAVWCEQTLLEKVLPSSRLFSPYWETKRVLSDHTPGETHEVEQVMGACLLMRPVERFDERFFLYCEDTELCFRLRRHGKVLYVPDAVFGHELGASSTESRWQSVARYNFGKELYFRIHRGQVASTVCLVLDRLGAVFRLMIWCLATLSTGGLVPRTRRQCGMFWKVLVAPDYGFQRPVE